MSKLRITLTPNMQREKPVVSLNFAKDCGLVGMIKTADDASPLDYIQELPGHCSSKTTEIYTHVSNKNLGLIKNSLDEIFDNTSWQWCFTYPIGMINAPFAKTKVKI